MPIKVGSRVFAPRIFPSIATLTLLVLLMALGRWQLQRADEKRRLFDAFEAGTLATTLLEAGGAPIERYQHVSAPGRFDSGAQILIDNMTSADGRAGYFVITPFALTSGGWVLVNRGWIAVGASRAELPDVAVPDNNRQIRGRVDLLPRPGIRMGQAQPLQPPFPIRATFPTAADIRSALPAHQWTSAAEVILLDSTQPDGFARRWTAPGFPPLRHIGYAVQWFALAAALVVIYIVTNLRR